MTNGRHASDAKEKLVSSSSKFRRSTYPATIKSAESEKNVINVSYENIISFPVGTAPTQRIVEYNFSLFFWTQVQMQTTDTTLWWSVTMATGRCLMRNTWLHFRFTSCKSSSDLPHRTYVLFYEAITQDGDFSDTAKPDPCVAERESEPQWYGS